MGRQDRPKASDIHRNTEYVFSKKASFPEAFPEIEALSGTVELSGHGVREWNRVRYLTNNVGEYMDCVNPVCYGGGFSLGSILRDMVRRKETHREELEICQGYEGSPGGKRRYRSCTTTFRIKIDIKYKDEQSAT